MAGGVTGAWVFAQDARVFGLGFGEDPVEGAPLCGGGAVGLVLQCGVHEIGEIALDGGGEPGELA